MVRHRTTLLCLFGAAFAAAAAPCGAGVPAPAPSQCLAEAAAAAPLAPATAEAGDTDAQVLILRFRPGSIELEPASRRALDHVRSCLALGGAAPRRFTLSVQAGERETAPGDALALVNDRRDEVGRRLRRAGVRVEAQASRVLPGSPAHAQVALRAD